MGKLPGKNDFVQHLQWHVQPIQNKKPATHEALAYEVDDAWAGNSPELAAVLFAHFPAEVVFVNNAHGPLAPRPVLHGTEHLTSLEVGHKNGVNIWEIIQICEVISIGK